MLVAVVIVMLIVVARTFVVVVVMMMVMMVVVMAVMMVVVVIVVVRVSKCIIRNKWTCCKKHCYCCHGYATHDCCAFLRIHRIAPI